MVSVAPSVSLGTPFFLPKESKHIFANTSLVLKSKRMKQASRTISP